MNRTELKLLEYLIIQLVYIHSREKLLRSIFCINYTTYKVLKNIRHALLFTDGIPSSFPSNACKSLGSCCNISWYS